MLRKQSKTSTGEFGGKLGSQTRAVTFQTRARLGRGLVGGAALLAMAVSVGGCSGRSETSVGRTSTDEPAAQPDEPTAQTDAPVAPETLEEFVEMFRSLLCASYEQCIGVDYCQQSTETEYDQLGVDLSRVTFHREAGLTCLDELRSDPCASNFAIQSDACKAVLEGTQQLNDSCQSSGECKHDLYCDLTEQCPGICRPSLAEGQPCSPEQDCKDGLDCQSAVCVVSPKVGESCAALDCELGLVCRNDICELVLPYQSQLGESCLDSSDCFGANYCDPETDRCMLAAELGEACGPKTCSYGLLCKDSVCQAPVAIGDSCTNDFECADYWCDAGKCRERGDIGADCSADLNCKSLNCNDGKCVSVFACRDDDL